MASSHPMSDQQALFPTRSFLSHICLFPTSCQSVPCTHLLQHHKLVLSSSAPVDLFLIPVEEDKPDESPAQLIEQWWYLLFPPQNPSPIPGELLEHWADIGDAHAAPALLPFCSLHLCTYLVLYSSTYWRMFCSSDSSSPLCPNRDSNLLLRPWM